jgi:hypothetical protein
MTPTITLQQREKQLQSLLGTPGGPGRTPRTGEPVFRSEWEGETGRHIPHHLYSGPGAGTGSDSHITK